MTTLALIGNPEQFERNSLRAPPTHIAVCFSGAMSGIMVLGLRCTSEFSGLIEDFDRRNEPVPGGSTRMAATSALL